MPRQAEARAWWADVEDVKERIEYRRARESRTVTVRGVREVQTSGRLTLVKASPPQVGGVRRRPRPRVAQRVGPRPDRIAGWAVLLGFLLVLVAVLSAHG